MKHPLICLTWKLAVATGMCGPALAAAAEPLPYSLKPERMTEFIAVIQHEGKPVAGAQVNFPYGEPQQTDATGSVYRYRNIAPFPNVRDGVFMMVRADGFATEYWQRYIDTGTTTQVIELARESPLTGRIEDAEGQPLARASLTAVPFPDPLDLPIGLDPTVGVARTDSAGDFSLHGLRSGQQYRIFIKTDNLSVANGERIVTVGNGPINFVLNAAAPVKLAISGLRGPFRGERQGAAIPKVSAAMISRGARACPLNKGLFERALSTQPDLLPAMGVTSGSFLPAILMEWLDPDTGRWVQVFSPRHVRVKDATHADLRFDQVPLGTIRILTDSGLEIAREMFGPMFIKAGASAAIPIRVTPLRRVQVKVIDREGRPASGMLVEFRIDADGLGWSGRTGTNGSFMFTADPTRDMKFSLIEAGKVISTTVVSRKVARSGPAVMHIRLQGRNPDRK